MQTLFPPTAILSARTKYRNRLLFIATVLSVACTLPAAPVAAWTPDGVHVAAYLASQDYPQATGDDFGGIYVVWADGRDPNSTDTDVYLQHLTADGLIAPGWAPSGTPVTTASFSQHPMNIGPDGEGGCYVTWVDYLTANIRLQRFMPSGVIATGWPQNGVQLTPVYGSSSGSLVLDGSGGVYATYASRVNGTSFAYVQRYSGDGGIAAGWSPAGRRIGTLTNSQSEPVAVSDDVGGIICVWEEVRPGPWGDVFAIRITPTGATSPGWPDNGINVCTAPHIQTSATAVSDGAGGALVVWEDFRAVPVVANLSEYGDVYAHHVLPAGAVDSRWPYDGLPICTKQGRQIYVRNCSDEQGGMIVAWEDQSGNSDVWAQRVMADATLAAGWTLDGNRVGGITPGYDHVFCPPVPDGSGGAYFAWQTRIDSPRHVRWQHLTSNGQVASGSSTGPLVVTTPGEQIDPWLVADGYGGAVAVWADSRLCYSCDQIYALRIAGDGPTAITVSLVSAEADPGVARLAWQMSGVGGSAFALERRTNAEGWKSLAPLSSNGSGRIVCEDRVPESGRYFYRLMYMEDGFRRETPEVQVDVPSAHVLSLAGFTPNPISSANLLVAFALPKQDGGSLVLFDVAGREVAHEDLSALGPGRHSLRLGGHGTIAAGMYWMRLTHGDRALTARGVVIR